MQKILYLFLGLFIGNFGLQAQGISFEKGAWEEVVAKATEENKPIFVDAYTTWCGPCKWMAKNVFPKKEVGDYMNANFISFKMDMEKGEGIDFRKKHNVNAFPTLLYFTPTGELLHKGVGGQSAEGLIALGKEATDPSKQLSSLQKKYDGGQKDAKFLKEYITALLKAYESIEVPFGEYWGGLSEKEKITEGALEIAAKATEMFADFRKPVVQFYLNNRDAYRKALKDPSIVDAYDNACFSRSIWMLSKIEDKKEQKDLSTQLAAYFPARKKEIKPNLGFYAARATNDEKKIAKALDKYAKVCNDPYFLNSIAWDVFENEDDSKQVKKALKWVTRSIDLDKNYANVDTKAALLYKLEKYTEAKEQAELAIKLAEEEKADPKGTQELLELIKAKL